MHGEETVRFLAPFALKFPMFSPMLFLLVKKNGNHVLLGFVLSSEQTEANNISFNFAHQIFLAFVAAQEIRDGLQAILVK